MNLQMEIIRICSVTSESLAAIRGITDISMRAWLFASACVYAMRAVMKLFRMWGIK